MNKPAPLTRQVSWLHRHADVQHHQVNRLFFQYSQRLIGRGSPVKFPRLVAQYVIQLGHGFEKGQVIIHKKHLVLFKQRRPGLRRIGRLGRPGRLGGLDGFGGFQAQLHLAQLQYLAGPQDRLGDAFALDEGAVGGIEVGHDDFLTPQQDFAMAARDGWISDSERVALSTSNRRPASAQLV
jgi:hypothetical protein